MGKTVDISSGTPAAYKTQSIKRCSIKLLPLVVTNNIYVTKP